MQYLIRSVKYFFYFAIITTLIVLALILIGAVEGGIESIFREGYNALWKMAIFFAVVAAIYPKIGFITRKLYVDGEWNDIRNGVLAFMRERHYEAEVETETSITFRRRDTLSRIAKMYEDRITLKRTDEGYCLEGLRKDVIRIGAGLEHRLTPHQEEQA